MHYPQSPIFNPGLAPRILIVRLSAHGDVIHSLPLLGAIKKCYPQAQIGWLVEASAESLLANHPLIDCLHVSHRKQWLQDARNPLRWPKVFREIGALVREIREAGYQLSFDVQGLLKSALWPVWAKIPVRFGYQGTRENADWFYTHKLSPMVIRDVKTPAIQRYLDFARAIGCPVEAPEFILPPVSPFVQQKVHALLASDAETEAPWVVLAPFTRWPSKHWPLSYWEELLPALLDLPIRLAILGAPSDEGKVSDWLQALPQSERHRVVNLVGKTDWPDLYALFQKTRLLIGLDSAPLHIADAVGVPEIIGLYGPTAPGRTGPIGSRHAVLSTALTCQPCFSRNCAIKTHDCMRQLTPQIVLGMVRKMLSLPAGKGFTL